MKRLEDIADEVLSRKGVMQKSPMRMNAEELKIWRRETESDIRERLFSIGQPLVVKKEGEFVAEYKNGHIKVL